MLLKCLQSPISRGCKKEKKRTNYFLSFLCLLLNQSIYKRKQTQKLKIEIVFDCVGKSTYPLSYHHFVDYAESQREKQADRAEKN